ncbi:tetratricopeptide repeat protein [Zooshikella harenae]|uniref:Tetratricopeptide repeat protein n=1 Tax=Zooshikella harenae TaxID=2827238 RepID=A0ABS5Z792_9GAMM|nr:tetratricopeptide repeat protein [Zooshikella harenae]MBU2709926.1 tetratricopeptide repeat protein [Zooshikella harenae]
MIKKRETIINVLFIFIGYNSILSSSIMASSFCGDLKNFYGPFDYTNPKHYQENLSIVEQYHFNDNIEYLQGGMSSNIMGDLTYTLRAFPNHHRALFTVIRYYTLLNTRHREKRYWSAECFLERALKFKPDDGIVHMLYGIYLHKKGKYTEALKKYQTALKYEPNNAELHYNIGLLYLKLKQYDKAYGHAQQAYTKNYPLQGLKNQLLNINLGGTTETVSYKGKQTD